MKYDLFILNMLIDRPYHGYELKKAIEVTLHTCCATEFGFSNSMLYPLLKKFEKSGLIAKNVVIQDGKPNKNIYEITPEGKAHYYAEINHFPNAIFYSHEDFYTYAIFFDEMEPETRQRFVSGRKKCLEDYIAYISGKDNSDAIDEVNRFLLKMTLDSYRTELANLAFLEERTGAPVKRR